VRTPHFIVTSDDGEKTARRIAEQFERIRYLYSHALQQDLRVDPATPIIIFAMKNEAALSQIMPEYWASKGNLHPAGLFASGPETNYIALLADAPGEFAYETVYHEYFHQIVVLNFHHFPVWLNEGFAEFFGRAKIVGKSGEFGDPSRADLQLLASQKLLPLETIFQVDNHSPYYNEADKANVFYAESWALVHFLMLDPERRQQGLLGKYERLVEDGTDPVAAARTAFGDLTQLRNELQAYVARSTYLGYSVSLDFDPKSIAYQVRTVPAAEMEARLANFDLNRGQVDAARQKIADAIRQNPRLAGPQESMGLLLYRQKNMDEADKYFERAISDGSQNGLVYLYHGVSVLARSHSENDADEAQASFEKAVALDPQLDLAWANLVTLYVQHEETAEQAVNAATKATALAPTVIGYQYYLGLAYVHARRYADARKVVARLNASSDADGISYADRILAQVNAAEKFASAPVAAQEAQIARVAPAQNAADDQAATPVIRHRGDIDNPRSAPGSAEALPQGATAVNSARVYSMLGTISDVNCNSAPEILLTLKSVAITMRLHGTDAEKLVTQAAGAKALAKGPVCAALRGRRAAIEYRLTAGKQWDGEIQSIELSAAP
jgi:Tfp pilus assembly protein PilF